MGSATVKRVVYFERVLLCSEFYAGRSSREEGGIRRGHQVLGTAIIRRSELGNILIRNGMSIFSVKVWSRKIEALAKFIKLIAILFLDRLKNIFHIAAVITSSIWMIA